MDRRSHVIDDTAFRGAMDALADHMDALPEPDLGHLQWRFFGIVPHQMTVTATENGVLFVTIHPSAALLALLADLGVIA